MLRERVIDRLGRTGAVSDDDEADARIWCSRAVCSIRTSRALGARGRPARNARSLVLRRRPACACRCEVTLIALGRRNGPAADEPTLGAVSVGDEPCTDSSASTAADVDASGSLGGTPSAVWLAMPSGDRRDGDVGGGEPRKRTCGSLPDVGESGRARNGEADRGRGGAGEGSGSAPASSTALNACSSADDDGPPRLTVVARLLGGRSDDPYELTDASEALVRCVSTDADGLGDASGGSGGTRPLSANRARCQRRHDRFSSRAPSSRRSRARCRAATDQRGPDAGPTDRSRTCAGRPASRAAPRSAG